MKLYYCGTRKGYFYLIYIAIQSYWNPPYREGLPSLENAISVGNKNQIKFILLYDEKTLSSFVRFYFSRPKILFSLAHRIKKEKEKLFKRYYDKFRQKALTKFSNTSLLKTYQEIWYLLRCLFYLNQIVWHLDIGSSKFLGNKFGNISLLTQPDEEDYLGEEETNFLRLCLKYFRTQKNLDRLLNRHLAKFAYVGRSYYNEPPRSKSDYLKRIDEFKKRGFTWRDFKELLNKKEKEFKNRLRARDKIYRLLDSRSKKMILVLREAVHLKHFFRGSVAEIVHYFVDPLFKEIADRFNIKEDQIKYLTNRELEQLFKGKKIDWKEIEKRKVYFAMGSFNHKFFLYYGERASRIEKKYFSGIIKEITKKDIFEIKGSSVYPGVVKGKVKVVLSPDDFKKFEREDILVSHITTPEYMPILSQAKAIITEIGGTTSHAAIISRELRIPCIIGTKIATRVLHDGDLVEVDANKGVIKILKKRK